MQEHCRFCQILERGEEWLEKTRHFSILAEPAPVSPGHLLIISNEHYADAFDLPAEAWADFGVALKRARAQTRRYEPAGFNVGMNCGTAAGQTQMHFHTHVMPRYPGDVTDPTGGVRNIFPRFVAPKT